MKERILGVLSENNRALLQEEIDSILEIKSVEDTTELSKCLMQMEKDGEIYRSNKNKYMLFTNSKLRKGKLTVNRKGFGFVIVEGEEEDIYVDYDDMNNAIDEDIVIVEIIKEKTDGKREGRIVRIVKRNVSTVVGEIYFKKQTGYLKPNDKKIKLDIEIPKNKNKSAVDGHIVVVKLESFAGKGKCFGEVIDILGHKSEPGVDILTIVNNYTIKYKFDDETLEELENIPEEIKEEELVGRRDLREEVIFTIDGDDTKDIDDAISIEKLENGNYKLGVHIADVSYYVKEGTAIDKEAMERGTSVYLVDRVIPMLPQKLSNGICSLNPEVDRLAMSCVMEIDDKGKTVNYEIFQSVIRSRIQMTYKNVNKILEAKEAVEGYDQFIDKLVQMKELSDIIRKSKVERGYIDFGTNEAKILVDENCVPTEIILRDRGVGENLIEDFMIQANECVATHVFYMELPFVYRVHEYPDEEKLRQFLAFLQTLGITEVGNIKDNSPKSVQKILESLKDRKEYPIISTMLLRNMKKAIYTPDNLGHYGLASKCYTHFTSPIRRYPDTTVHRLLRTYMINNDMTPGTIGHWQEKLVYVTEHSSETERNSIECERDVESMKMAEYMEQHIGETFKGMISSLTNFGMFVQLKNLIEGLVPISELGEFMNFDETSQTYTGERTNMKYRLGDEVEVKVKFASKQEKKIDFQIIKKL